jgi:peptidoglycan-associated lipoprotein
VQGKRRLCRRQELRLDALRCADRDAGSRHGDAAATVCRHRRVHFDFNSSDLGDAARAELQKVAACLEKMGAVRVRVEGFCDERGTEEYNLALGQRRAYAVEKYLEDLGIQRMSSISYGKDAPLCTQDTEACWKRNRRAEFDVKKK